MANQNTKRVTDAAQFERKRFARTTSTAEVSQGASACTAPVESFDSIVDSKGLSKILGLHEMSIRRMVSQGRLPHYKIGSSVRFNLTEVLEFVHRSAEGGVQ